MSLTAFLVFGTLGIDFLTYYWCDLTFGDNRAMIARKVADLRAQFPPLRRPAANRSAALP